ncbi:MAG: hypothetical protein ACE141_06030 [Bryobacteraceae bacterium]
MARACSICSGDPERRAAIDAALIGGASFRDIARQFRATKDAVARHRSHIRQAVEQADQGRQRLSGERVLQEFEQLRGRVIAILNAAEGQRNYLAAIRAIGEARQLLEAAADLAGLREQPMGPRIVGATFTLYTPEGDQQNAERRLEVVGR